MINLTSTFKKDSAGLDKACTAEETIHRVTEKLHSLFVSILAETVRIDTGVLGIPVFLSRCGADAQEVMPTKKQMGKGATPEQAEASALMELMERYGYFTYWRDLPETKLLSWREALSLFSDSFVPHELINTAFEENLSTQQIAAIMGCRNWIFASVTHIATGRVINAPIELFKLLNEFNGASAGNTDVESILQGACELVERHVCALADKTHPVLPTINLDDIQDPVLIDLINKFKAHNITLVLKDMTMDMPVPTVAALAMNPATFPETSEIVFTAGTACTPEKAAIRAITEVAQLAGDFCTSACYEPSGLSKYSTWEETEWLRKGSEVSLAKLPRIVHDDMLIELQTLARSLSTIGFDLYSLNTTNPATGIPSHYSFVPGFAFRERDENPSLGMFVSRLVTEEEALPDAFAALKTVEQIYPNAHFLPFYRGMANVHAEDYKEAIVWFEQALSLQPNNDSRALVTFYHAYAFTKMEQWENALPFLDQSITFSPDFKEAFNLRGVCHFRMQQFEKAAADFSQIVTRLDKSSLLDIFNLGMSYRRMDDIPMALKYLNAALMVDPSFVPAREQIAELANL